MPEIPPLSKTEWTIMNLVWKLKKATARQIHEASLDERKREYATVKTMLERIAAKGYLTVERVGPVKVYRPKVGRRRAVTTAVEDFVDNVLEHSLAPLYLHLSERDDLSAEEIEFFKRQLEKKEES